MSRSRSTLAGSAGTFAKLAAFAFLLSTAVPARAQTPVVFGDTITDPGVYFLAGNQSGSGTGVIIESDDVTLLLLRFTLRGNGSDAGVFCSGYDNVAVYGGRVTNFKLGIVFAVCEHCTVKDTRIDHCGVTGLSLSVVDESSFVRLRSDHNALHGVTLFNGFRNRFISVLSHDNGEDGILIVDEEPLPVSGAAGDESNGNKVKLCWAAYNGRDGIHLRDTRDCDVSRNECVGNSGAGIHLEATADESDEVASLGADSRDNRLESNWCVFNGEGIAVEWGSTGNTMTNNTSLANVRDMVDDNAPPPCANTWFLNLFLSKGGDGAACIF